jgi:hypothetical protein
MKRVGLVFVSLLLVVCLGGAAVSLITNRNLPTEEMDAAQLSDLDKARLAEIFHLRRSLGDAAWPGWGDAAIPVIVYNEAYAFLVGYEGEPPPGWVTVPGGEQRGEPWQAVSDDDFQGERYYRTALPEDGPTPQAFTVQVGEAWVASLHTRPAMRVMMAQEFRQMLPEGVREALPYALATNLFLRNSDAYVAAVLHESFHAYQGIEAGERLAAAERAGRRWQEAYPHQDEAFVAAWQAELDLLQAAVRAEDAAETADLTRQFLAGREARREAANLSPELIDYERQREWTEGAALYNELHILRQAYGDDAYRPVAAMAADPEFDAYEKFEQRWRQETDQMTRMAGNDGDGRFYYSGMAQAVLLDRLSPGWKTRYFADGVFLEDLLRTAVAD